MGVLIVSSCTPESEVTGTVIDVPDLEDGQRKEITADGVAIELHRRGTTLVATVLLCTHQGCRLKWDGAGYACPCHGGYFSAEGEPKLGPPRQRLRRFPVSVDDGQLSLKL